LANAFNLTFGPDGNLYVAEFSPAHIRRYNGTSGAYIDEFVTPGAGGLTGAAGLAFGPDGNLYVASYFQDRILRYNGTTGAYIDDFVTTGSGGLDGPWAILFVPEPASIVLLALGGLLLNYRRRS
jgi:sugar lactone lactonase YvrE